MKLLEGLIKFIESDKSGEGRTNSLMILARYEVMLCLLLHFIYCAFLSISGYYPVNAVYLVSSAVLIAAFVLSFFINRSDVIVAILAFTTYFACASAGPYLGWIIAGYGYMYVTLMLLWYDSTKSVAAKLIMSVMTTVAVAVLFIMRGDQLDIELKETEYIVLLVVNTVILGICISLAAYQLCRDNVSDERKLMQYNEKLRHMAGIDPLTGLMNRRSIGEKFEELLKEETQCVTVAMGDIDFFKKVNDTRGHDCGDYVLKTLSAKFQNFMNGKGYVSRWGGEEFVFIFENINGDDAYPMLEELRREIEKMDFEFFSHKFNITMTFGVEEYSPMFGSEEAIKKADEKLYIGKESGRNQVVY